MKPVLLLGALAFLTAGSVIAADCDDTPYAPTPPEWVSRMEEIFQNTPFLSLRLKVAPFRGQTPKDTQTAISDLLSAVGLKTDSYADHDSISFMSLAPSAASEARHALIQMFSDLDWEGAQERIRKLPFVESVDKTQSFCIPTTTVWENPRSIIVPDCHGGRSRTRKTLSVSFKKDRVYEEQRAQVLAAAGADFRAGEAPKNDLAGTLYLSARGPSDKLNAALAKIREKHPEAVISAEIRYPEVATPAK